MGKKKPREDLLPTVTLSLSSLFFSFSTRLPPIVAHAFTRASRTFAHVNDHACAICARARCRDDEFGTRRWFFVTCYYPFTIIVSSRFGHKELNLISPLVYNVRVFDIRFLPSLRLERSSETSSLFNRI